MNRALPPIAATRAFEAAARHLSFTKAASELCVSQSAISHQVRQLEDFLGCRLFRRDPRGLSLTPEGASYRAEVAGLFDALEESTARLRRTAEAPLAVRSTPAFAARWLIPRMRRFTEATGIELRLHTGLPPTDFAGGLFDVVIHWGDAPVPGVVVEPFMSTPKIAVCSAGLLQGRERPRVPDDLAGFTLLHDEVGDCWAEWLRGAGSTRVDPDKGPSFAHCDLVLDAVEHDQGVALAYAALVERELASGRFVRLFEHETVPKTIYSVAYEAHRQRSGRIRRFRDWIFAESGRGAHEAAAAE